MLGVTTTLRTDQPTLAETAQQMTSGGRGVLAADESIKTMSARLEAEGIPASDVTHRDYRELLVTADGLSESVSGIILCDETFGQELSDGRPFPVAARELGILPGIKVDTGTRRLPGQGGALITEGLDGLGARLASYAERGAAFAKWRAVFDVTTTNEYVARANAHALARYAALCQEHGIVPIVEPKVLCNGDHALTASAETTGLALASVFEELDRAGVGLTGIVLKPNFATPGLDAPAVPASDVAAATYEVLLDTVPAAVPGIAFLTEVRRLFNLIGSARDTIDQGIHWSNWRREHQPKRATTTSSADCDSRSSRRSPVVLTSVPISRFCITWLATRKHPTRALVQNRTQDVSANLEATTLAGDFAHGREDR
jgi:fructose-bisphosphate aldolase class I